MTFINPSVEIAIPFHIDGTGSIAKTPGESARLSQHLLSIIGTLVGERLMLLGYGTNTRGMVFDLNDPIQETILTTSIETALRQWEPAVTISAVTANQDPANPAMMNVVVAFSVAPNQTVYSVQVALGGGLVSVQSF